MNRSGPLFKFGVAFPANVESMSTFQRRVKNLSGLMTVIFKFFCCIIQLQKGPHLFL